MENQDRLIIDGWQIDVDSHRINRDGVEKKLEPRGMALLVYLAGRAGQVVSREAIEAEIWEGRVVSYEALSGAVAKIRKAFDDTGKQNRIIETVPKSGYRLIAPVTVEPLSSAPMQVPPTARKPGIANRLIIAAALLISMTGAILWWFHPGQSEQPSIAVLPFTNMSSDPEQEYFADGMTDDLITDLSKVPGLFVISRNSTAIYKGAPVDIREVAEKLGVRYVMEGSVQKVNNQVRINAQLIDSTTGGHAWSERYDGALDDVFSMRDRITRQIAAELSVALVDGDLTMRERYGTQNAEAYDALLRGRDHYELFTPEDLIKAIPFLERAIELDPDFGQAHAQLAAVYWGICNNGWSRGANMTYAECDAKTGEHLDAASDNPTPLAHRIAARRHEYSQRYDEALSEAGKAIELNPRDPNGYEAMSALLVNLGRPAEGLEHIETAMRLDPNSDYLWRLGYAQFHLERYEDAAATMLRATKRNPDYDWNYLLLAAAYGHLGREQEARQAVDTFNRLRFDLGGKKKPYTLADLQYWSIKNEAGLNRLREGMRKAGVPAG